MGNLGSYCRPACLPYEKSSDVLGGEWRLNGEYLLKIQHSAPDIGDESRVEILEIPLLLGKMRIIPAKGIGRKFVLRRFGAGSGTRTHNCAQCLQGLADECPTGCPIDPHLRHIARNWGNLPDAIKDAILAMVNSVAGGAE